MDRTERFYKIDQLLSARGVVSLNTFLHELEISSATFKRDLEYLRERLNAPIIWDRDAGGYRYKARNSNDLAFTLPGIWFNASETHALLLIQQLLNEIHPGLLGPQIQPLQVRFKALLGSADHSAEEVEKRFRMIHAAKRISPLPHFEKIASATLSRKQLKITHFNRERNESSERVISPQQIVFYRDNWYIDAWCHWRADIRSFAIDAILSTEIRLEPAKELTQEALKNHFEKGYGIFSGDNVQWAELRFSPARARWVANESWHAEQQGTLLPEGAYLLKVPYSDDRELLMDILRHGDEVEVLAPESLRKKLKSIVQKMLKKY